MTVQSYPHQKCRKWLSGIPVSVLKGVGPKTLSKLHELGLVTVQDVLFHLPHRYEDRSRIVAIKDLEVGRRSIVAGSVGAVTVSSGYKRFMQCELRDDTGVIKLRFFHFNKAQSNALSEPGVVICCFGEVKPYSGSLVMSHPEYRPIDKASDLMLKESLSPVYPTTKGLKQSVLRKLAKQAVSMLDCDEYVLDECLPDKVRQKYSLVELKLALKSLHFPDVIPGADLEQYARCQQAMRYRLVFEEMLAHQLSMLQVRSLVHQRLSYATTAFSRQQELIDNLPFDLTLAQQKVMRTINNDLKQSWPMLRLMQGDVGCGKTIIAIIASIAVADSGFQVALMAPTELLVEQHYRNFKQALNVFDINVGQLSGGMLLQQKRDVLSSLASGAVQIIIGTHALIQEQVKFNKLGLLIVDEQHRFGVSQRLALQEKGSVDNIYPHQLTMTATPIPRSLAMSAYGDMDYSVIDELPSGRIAVKTALLSQQKRQQVVSRVYDNCLSGKQAYWVCTLVEESEALQCQAAETVAQSLQQAMPKLVVGLVHGRMSAAEKENIMHKFAVHKIDVLVATTVIEVGVDVANASLMIIENPERLGLAQLHQLRGRVGRGDIESYCVLLYEAPLSKSSAVRLQVIKDSNDGFQIAHEDLVQRGPGEVLGVKQAGMARYRIADLIKDNDVLQIVHELAFELTVDMADCSIQILIDRWLGCLGGGVVGALSS